MIYLKIWGFVLGLLSIYMVIFSVVNDDFNDNDKRIIASFSGFSYIAGILILLYCYGFIK